MKVTDRKAARIEQTRRQIAGSAAQLQKLAERALAETAPGEPTVADVMQKCSVDIREITRKNAIEAATNGNAQRWTERVKRAKAAMRGVEVEDFNWGALFTGTKAALIKAGLVSAELIPAKYKQKEYRLPLNQRDGYNAACFGPTWGKIPPCWDARVSLSLGDHSKYSVWVGFNHSDDIKVRERAALALAEMDRPDMNMALLRQLVAEIPPVQLSVAIPEQIEAAKKYPKSKYK